MAQHPANGTSFRATQRAPRSCLSCASRKIKCDKFVPCSPCIKRGQAEACDREIVIVRGEVTSWQGSPHIPTYEELRRENERMRQEIAIIKAKEDYLSQKQSVPESTKSPQIRNSVFVAKLEAELWQSLSSASTTTHSSIQGWEDIILPSPECSRKLIAFDETWNSWVHYALEYPHFTEECDSFMDRVGEGLRPDEADVSWMAVYFSVLSTALLMMNDDEAEGLPLPKDYNQREISRNWYDAALFCLYKADFMRVPSLRSVQAIAILGMSFNNRGDSELGQHLWNSAIRIARRIGLDTPYSSMAGSHLSAEGQHRLWWTLVICEWLNLQCWPPAVNHVDFDVPLPSATWPNEQGTTIHLAHYHIFMARTASVVYRFRAALHSEMVSLCNIAEVVRKADEELAEIIDTLPQHLQPDTSTNDEVRQLELAQPWIKWQRYDLTLVLLHLRLRINCILQEQWLSSPNPYDWARGVSIKSALSVIWINRNWDQPVSMRKQWALSYHIFAAAVLLIHECQGTGIDANEEYYEAIQAALELLDGVKSQNAVAYHAARILRENIETIA